MIHSINKLLAVIFSTVVLSACGNDNVANQVPSNSVPKENSLTQPSLVKQPFLTVYKDPNCGCCVDWITHVEEHGYATKTVHPQDLWAIKSQYKIAGNMQSCHTAVTGQGYVFEGHVPAKFMDQFLANPPQGAVGLTVPAMVVGSPGMEVGDKFKAYHIMLLNSDGSSELYQAINSYQQQF